MIRSLFARTALILAAVFLLFQAMATLVVYHTVVKPVAERSADDLAALIVLSAQTWVELPPEVRPAFERELAERHACGCRRQAVPFTPRQLRFLSDSISSGPCQNAWEPTWCWKEVEKLKNMGVQVKHILVTREHSMVGWKLWDEAWTTNLSSDVKIFQSGMPFKELYMLYCAADVYMSCSKGEGLGLPIMEAMSVGVPIVANRTGALQELLADNRGWLVDYAFKHIDPFGNQTRYFVDRNRMADALHEVKKLYETETQTVAGEITTRTAKARAYMESKSWDRPAKQIEDAIEKL